MQDSAVAVPFVPSTPNSNPQSQKAPSTSTPLGQAAPSSRPTDGQAVGSTPLPSASPAQHADDSAHASPQGVDADGSVVSTTDAAIAMDGQLSRSQDADAAAAAVTSQASRQTDSQTDSCVTSHMGPSLPTQAEPHVHIGPDAVMQQTGQPTASTSTAALESHSHGTPSTPDAQAGAVISSEAHAADAALGQRMIDSALSISAKEIALTPQLGSPTAPGVSMESQDVSTTGQGLSPAAQVLGTSVQGVSPSAQGVSASAEGVKVAAAASNTDAKDAAGSSEKQAAGSVQGSQMSMTATTLTSSDETDTADRQTNAAVRTAPTAASDGSKADEAQAQGPGLIPAFLGTAAQTGASQQHVHCHVMFAKLCKQLIAMKLVAREA